MQDMDKETEAIIKLYILKLLELQETRLNCINLGFSKDREIKGELELVGKAIEFMKQKTTNNTI